MDGCVWTTNFCETEHDITYVSYNKIPVHIGPTAETATTYDGNAIEGLVIELQSPYSPNLTSSLPASLNINLLSYEEGV